MHVEAPGALQQRSCHDAASHQREGSAHRDQLFADSVVEVAVVVAAAAVAAVAVMARLACE